MTQNNKIQIIIALIGLIGALLGALIGNWDKVFPPNAEKQVENLPVPAPRPTKPIQENPQLTSNTWLEHLRGHKLTHIFTRNGYLQKNIIWLCPGGYFYSHLELVGASDAEISKIEGRWSLSGSLNRTTLLLDDTNYTLTFDGTKLFLNGKRYFRNKFNAINMIRYDYALWTGSVIFSK